MNTLFLGDCLDVMRKMDADSIDAIVTDPPYGLAFMGAKWDNFGGKSCGNDSAEVRRQKAEEYAEKNSGAPRYANGHGGAPTLDAMRSFQEYMTPIFAEALRVAKPGAHLLAFGGTRTYHRLACAIEDAGWEVRDCIMWVYGSGFPKSMDVSKAIDKTMGAKRNPRNGSGDHVGNINFGMKNRCPKCGKPYFSGNPCTCPREDGIPATPEAAAWSGWGTCLKPACEPIVVARKPLEGTVAANVLKYGTGAINIDGCRVPTEDAPKPCIGNGYRSINDRNAEQGYRPNSYSAEKSEYVPSALGRFPANLIHDGSEEVLALFPDTCKSSGGGMHTKGVGDNKCGNAYGAFAAGEPTDSVGFGDTGSAARFFYCAKASRAERGEGNVHPTVKPLALMRYLVRLVTRKGGLVLDPFMGSGTTGIAAVQEGMRFVGIEKDEHYYEIAQQRVTKAKPITSTTQQELPL